MLNLTMVNKTYHWYHALRALDMFFYHPQQFLKPLHSLWFESPRIE